MRAKGGVRVWAAGVDECFWVCLEKRDWDEARACSLTSMDCSLGNVPANRVCVCARAYACMCVCVRACVLHAQTVVASNHDLQRQGWGLLASGAGGGAATTRFPQSPSSSLSPSCPLLTSFVLSLSHRNSQVNNLYVRLNYSRRDLLRVHINQSAEYTSPPPPTSTKSTSGQCLLFVAKFEVFNVSCFARMGLLFLEWKTSPVDQYLLKRCITRCCPRSVG